jgi:hypothetical protein
MADIRQLAQFRQRSMPDQSADGAIIDTARVVRRDAEEFLLLTAGTLALRGKKAAGCLLEPEENDTVLVARNTPEGVFILTVLERGGAASRIVLPGNATLSAEGGTLRLTGDSVELAGEKTASLEAPEIRMQGVRGDVSFLNLSLTASVAEAKAGKLSLVASVIDTVSERITQRVRDCFRRVTRMDSTRAGQVSISTENRFDLKADAVSMIAQCEVKIDGDKIHLG